MKLLYDNSYRSYGKWNETKPEASKEIPSLSKLLELMNDLDNNCELLIVLDIDPETNKIIFGRYNGDY